MKTTARTLLLITFALMVGLAGCKKGKETETAADEKPTRPPSPSGTMSLRGNYAHVASVGTFQDCSTGQQWRVSREGDNGALEKAYLESKVPLGAPLLVTVEGGIDLRPSPEGGQETLLIVARFVKTWPGEGCPVSDDGWLEE